MPTNLSVLFVLLLVPACGNGTTTPPVSGPGPEPPSPAAPRWQAFAIADIQAERAQRDVAFFEFLSEPALRMGLYHLSAGSDDGQEAHNEDEVYYVVKGAATLTIDGRDHSVDPGSAFFVRANVDHRFHTITADLDVLVVFSKKPTSPADPAGLRYSSVGMTTPRDSTANVWNPFLVANSMSLGMYMLPRTVGGDGVLTHPFDEINIVVTGRSQFVMGSDAVDIEPGSIVYVQDGVGHSFGNLSADVDVLILWER